MKPIPAIVEPAQIDVDLLDKQLAVALSGKSDAERTAERHEQLAMSARETAKMRRLEIGRILTKLRAAWPERGPNAKPWGELLARHKLAESTARMYMDEYRDPKGFAEKSAKPRGGRSGGDDDGDAEPVAGQERDLPPFRQATKGDLIQMLGRLSPEDRKDVMDSAGSAPAPALALTPDPTTANVHGGSGERKRGSYCTPKKLARAVGPFDVDPFSNPRSHVAAVDRCMLENGGDGLVVGEPGSYRVGADGAVKIATATTRVWIQPDYRIVLKAIAHFGHTRFTALLRFAPDTRWFRAMWPRVAVVAVPPERIPFETPAGIEIVGADEGEDAGAPFPHVLYYSDPRDITEEIARTCILLNRYEALRLVH